MLPVSGMHNFAMQVDPKHMMPETYWASHPEVSGSVLREYKLTLYYKEFHCSKGFWLPATYLTPACIGRRVRLGSKSWSGAASGAVIWKSGPRELEG